VQICGKRIRREGLCALKDHGLDPDFVEVPGGTHSTAVEIMMPRIVEFFARQQRKIL